MHLLVFTLNIDLEKVFLRVVHAVHDREALKGAMMQTETDPQPAPKFGISHKGKFGGH